MALKDWHGWHIGIAWVLGIAIVWLAGRLGVAAVSGDAVAGSARVTGGGAPLWTTGVTLVIVTVLIIITVRWVRGRILDQ
jgi:hypothetical protein